MDNYVHSDEFFCFCHNTFQNLKIPVNFLDNQGKIIYANKAFGDFMEIPRVEIIGKNFKEINPETTFIDAINSKKTNVAKSCKFPNGKKMVCSRFSITNDKGDAVGGLGIVLFDELKYIEKITDENENLNKMLNLYKKEIAICNNSIYTMDNIIGKCDNIKQCKRDAEKMATVNLNLMIMGEKGVGKNIFANAIHKNSNRKNKPFITINCASISKKNFDVEFFGYEEGDLDKQSSFNHMGKLELANGGTIFLQQISELPYDMQAKLLSVIKENSFTRIGGKNSIQVDIRFICSSSPNIYDMVKWGKVREELYYRLNVLSINIPTLSERRDDIPILIELFKDSLCSRMGLTKNINKNVVDILVQYDWTENVKELKNVVKRICLNSSNTDVTIEDLPSYITKNCFIDKSSVEDKSLGELLNKVELEIILKCLKKYDFNKEEVAKRLKIRKNTLYRKIKQYGLE